MKILLNLILLFLLGKNFFAQNIEKTIHLDVKRNYLEGNVVMYLKVSGYLTDSAKIDHLNFKTDSLLAVNDTMWHYFFSLNKKTERIQQVIITELNKKIHYALVSDYKYSHFQNLIDDSTFYDEPLIKQYVVNLNENYIVLPEYDSINRTLRNDTILNGEYPIFLKYEPQKKIYFQQREILNGEFCVTEIDFLSEGHFFNNEEVFSINFINIKMIFYKNKWYLINTHPHPYNMGIRYNLIPFELFFRITH